MLRPLMMPNRWLTMTGRGELICSGFSASGETAPRFCRFRHSCQCFHCLECLSCREESIGFGFDSRRLPKKLNRKAYHRCGHQPVIATAGYSSQADQFQIGGCLLWVAQASTVSSSRSSESAILGEANLRIGLKSSEVDWAIRWKAGDNARSGATPLTSQPQTNPTYQHPDPLYSSLALFETTNRVL